MEIVEYLSSTHPIKKKDGTWYNIIIDEDGEVIREIVGEGYNEVMTQMKGIKSKAREELKKQRKQKLKEDVFQLENIIGGGGLEDYIISNQNISTKSNNVQVDKIDHVNDNLALQRAKYKKNFDAADNQAKIEAENLLKSIITLYFKQGLIGNNEYLKYKMDVEKKSLQALLFQLEQAKRTIYKLTEDLHLGLIPGGSVSRTIEVMNGLQKTVLDISKYQHELVRDLEKAVREFKNEMVEEGKVNEDIKTIGENTEEQTDAIFISESDRKKLISDMKSFLLEHKEDLQVHKSKNNKLNNAEDIEFIDNKDEKPYLDDDVDGEADGNEKYGLESF